MKVDRNNLGLDFIVRDIHGHLYQLDKQPQEVAFDPSCNRLFCLGDINDKSPNSESFLTIIDHKTYFNILSNHKAMVIAKLENPDTAPRHKSNAGE
ncbi:hypothetical protein [Microbulbifer sp. JMSA008]|uniref:hypothetical protein n=1 Tax=Microbulbifer sp. JMSA008 TaxID=3243373 RepID=UPI004039CAD5